MGQIAKTLNYGLEQSLWLQGKQFKSKCLLTTHDTIRQQTSIDEKLLNDVNSALQLKQKKKAVNPATPSEDEVTRKVSESAGLR